MKPFRFKQFSLLDNNCAHKIGTDGVLLGAWASHPSPKRILDVGCGSGLIAMMLAQRYSTATIHGVEVESLAAQQARENVKNSIFKSQIEIFPTDFNDFKPTLKYDLIVSNPPFFVSSTPSGIERRDKARHQITLTLKTLLKKAKTLIAKDGNICLILPSNLEHKLHQILSEEPLFLNNFLKIKGSITSPVKRIMATLSYSEKQEQAQELVLRDEEGKWSKAYKKLTVDFHPQLPPV